MKKRAHRFGIQYRRFANRFDKTCRCSLPCSSSTLFVIKKTNMTYVNKPYIYSNTKHQSVLFLFSF